MPPPIKLLSSSPVRKIRFPSEHTPLIRKYGGSTAINVLNSFLGTPEIATQVITNKLCICCISNYKITKTLSIFRFFSSVLATCEMLCSWPLSALKLIMNWTFTWAIVVTQSLLETSSLPMWCCQTLSIHPVLQICNICGTCGTASNGMTSPGNDF